MMNFFSGALPDAIGQGVLWSMMVLGVYITFRILDVADLTVDGSFSFGGCTSGTDAPRHPLAPDSGNASRNAHKNPYGR